MFMQMFHKLHNAEHMAEKDAALLKYAISHMLK